MPTKRLVLAQPATDSEGILFPYLDVRLGFAGTFGLTKGGAVESDDELFVESPFTAELKLRFYRVAGGVRIYLAEEYRVVERIFEAKQRIRLPADTGEQGLLFVFWDYLFIYTTPEIAAIYEANTDDIRDQSGIENSFEAITIDNFIFNGFPMIDCLKTLITQEGGSDFAGLTVVEDAE